MRQRSGWRSFENGWRVLFIRTTDLVQRLQVARRELALEAAITKLDKYHLLILDDIAYVTKDQAETSVLFELIAARYERRSLLITANQPFGEWGKIFPDQGHDAGGHRPARAPRHDPGDERRELSPQSRAQTQAWHRRLNGKAAQPHNGKLQALMATTAVTLRDRCQGSDFASLSGNSGHGAIFGAHRSVAIDPLGHERRRAALLGSIAIQASQLP